MTEIGFHFNVPETAAYACRLVRKATRRGAQVAVTGTDEMLARLDRDLWAFDPVEFIPHLRLRSGEPAPERLRATRVWLVEQASSAPHQDVLVNLGREAPAGFESFARLIEIVSTAEDDRLAARQRWKRYKDRGYAISQHEVAE
jgi:DNA polymerase III subunit chi